MSDEKTWTQAAADRLAEMLRIGLENDGGHRTHADEEKEHLLRARLASTLPLDRETGDEPPIPAGPLLPMGGASLGGTLLDEGTPLELIQKLKDHGKRPVAAKESEAEHAVAVTLYFAAIASALVSHDQKITSYADASLAESFASLANMPWMDPELAEHFAKACGICKRRER